MHQEQRPRFRRGFREYRLASVHRRADAADFPAILDLQPIVRAREIADRWVIEQFVHVPNEILKLGHGAGAKRTRTIGSTPPLRPPLCSAELRAHFSKSSCSQQASSAFQ